MIVSHLLNILIFTAGTAVHKFSLCFACTDQWASGQYGSQKNHHPWLKCHENDEKIDNDYVLRNGHRIKTIQPISMILVSFFSEDNVLSDEIKICCIFEYQSNANRAFRFFGTPGIDVSIHDWYAYSIGLLKANIRTSNGV